jgi:hypothetical protein
MVIIKITLYLREKKYINILPITLFKFGAFGIFFFFFGQCLTEGIGWFTSQVKN